MITQHFSNKYREQILQQISEIDIDVLVIGGGITGSGITLDLSTRGMKTVCLEMQDFAEGTSSRSTKLIHGGLRYLKNYEFKLVAEVGKERAIVYENGPHITKPEFMLLPIYKYSSMPKFVMNIGLAIYDFLAKVKKKERYKMFTKEEILQRIPLISDSDLIGGGYYVEYRTDDARLTIEVMKKAVSLGAHALNYIKVNDFIWQGNRIVGVVATDLISGQSLEIKARKVINATGPWVSMVKSHDHNKVGKDIKCSKGVHLVVSKNRIPIEQAIYFELKDKRMFFVVPRDNKVYFGTTDTFYSRDPSTVKADEVDVNYLIASVNEVFPSLKITINDIEATWAGVRPLIFEDGKKEGEVSRKDEIWVSESGLITIAGGKLTGYRKIAEDVGDIVARNFESDWGISFKRSHTHYLPISGGDVGGSDNWNHYRNEQYNFAISQGLSDADAKMLTNYGSNANILISLAVELKEQAAKYGVAAGELAKLKYAIEFEMVYHPHDYIIRRSSYFLFDRDKANLLANFVIDYMAVEFNWSDDAVLSYKNQISDELSIRTIA